MRLVRSMIVLAAVPAMVFAEANIATAENPAAEEREATVGQRRGGSPQGRGGRGRGRGRRGIATMTVSLTAWTDGGRIPLKYTQVGAKRHLVLRGVTFPRARRASCWYSMIWMPWDEVGAIQ